MHKVIIKKSRSNLSIEINPPIKFDPYQNLSFISSDNLRYLNFSKIELFTKSDTEDQGIEEVIYTLYPTKILLELKLSDSDINDYISSLKNFLTNLTGKDKISFN